LTVERFRTIEEMAAAPVVVPPGEGFERFARQCARYWKIAPRVYPRGVFRFRALAEAQSARERVTDENVARMRCASPRPHPPSK
jgi:hypothetical protein